MVNFGASGILDWLGVAAKHVVGGDREIIELPHDVVVLRKLDLMLATDWGYSPSWRKLEIYGSLAETALGLASSGIGSNCIIAHAENGSRSCIVAVPTGGNGLRWLLGACVAGLGAGYGSVYGLVPNAMAKECGGQVATERLLIEFTQVLIELSHKQTIVLLGYSVGAEIAIRLAVDLSASGVSVAGLVLVDPRDPAPKVVDDIRLAGGWRELVAPYPQKGISVEVLAERFSQAYRWYGAFMRRFARECGQAVVSAPVYCFRGCGTAISPGLSIRAGDRLIGDVVIDDVNHENIFISRNLISQISDVWRELAEAGV